MATEQVNDWDFQAAEGPRPYRIEVKEAAFRKRTKKNGDLIQFGRDHLYELALWGQVTYLDEDGNDAGLADTPETEDFPIRTFSIGTSAEVADDNEDGQALTSRRPRFFPRSAFEGHHFLNSMRDAVGSEWLQKNLGSWASAESYVGHAFTVEPYYKLDKDGEPIVNSNDYKLVLPRVTAVDGVMGN